jgi:hypothetical protein
MNATVFDTLAYSNKLRAVGFTERQAEVQAGAIFDLVDNKLATKKDIIALKRDIQEVEGGLKGDIIRFEKELRRDIQAVEGRLKKDIQAVEERVMYKLTMRLGGMFVTGFSILAVLIKIH